MTLADEQGHFALDNTPKGTYRVWITMVGYKDYKSDPVIVETQAVTLPAITLEQSGAQQEVSIIARKPFVERKADRTVVNEDALLPNTGAIRN